MRFNSVGWPFNGKRIKDELLARRRRQAPLVVFDDNKYRQIPYCRDVDCFVKITF